MEQFVRQMGQLIQLIDPVEFTESGLMKACVFGNLNHVRRIVEDGRTNLNGQDRFGMTPVARAYVENNNDIVRYMASEPRVDLSIPDNDGVTVFQAACHWGDFDMLQYLVCECDVEVTCADVCGASADVVDYLLRNASPWSRVPALWRGG